MIGKPLFRLNDLVEFIFGEKNLVGTIAVVDAYGTFFQSEEPSYDIFVQEENMLYKHVQESLVKPAEN